MSRETQLKFTPLDTILFKMLLLSLYLSGQMSRFAHFLESLNLFQLVSPCVDYCTTMYIQYPKNIFIFIKCVVL